jgi:hypothetical protein
MPARQLWGRRKRLPMTFQRKALLWLLSCVACFAGGLALQSEPEPQVIVQKVVQEGKKETVFVDKIVTRIVKPDGTVIERQHDKQQTTKQETVKRSEKPVVVLSNRTKYSLDVSYLPSLRELPSSRDVEVDVGYRLGQSNAWLTTGYSVKYNQVSLGIRYEF